MRLHVVSLPHTVTSKEYCSCAYTQKVLNFCKMMRSLGYTVFHYGGEGSVVDCDEHITVISSEQRKKWWGANDWRKEFYAIDWDPKLDYWVEANKNAVREIASRIQPKDFICLIGGNCQKPIADAFPKHMSVEFGIGYSGVFSPYRVFESFAHMHYLYGQMKVPDGLAYDCVIPNYFDPSDFPASSEQDDYFLFVGRLISRKGAHVAAEICNRLGKTLLVAGQGVIHHEPGKIVAKEITLTGNVKYIGTLDVAKRAHFMGRAKAVFCPTQYIGPFEGVSVEAMLCGTPVITTDWGCFTETVVDGRTGFRVRTLGEGMACAKKVGELDRDFIRGYALARYSIDVVRHRYDDYFRQLMTLWGDGWFDTTYTGEDKRLGGNYV